MIKNQVMPPCTWVDISNDDYVIQSRKHGKARHDGTISIVYICIYSLGKASFVETESKTILMKK